MQRFMHGPGFFEQQVMARTVLANSPVETVDRVSMLDAIDSRQSALDDLRDFASDSYYINRGLQSSHAGPPLPTTGDPAVMHRFRYVGNDRWETQSLVPRDGEAGRRDPITVEFSVNAEDGSPKRAALVEWSEWGIPFTDLPAHVATRGGPFGHESHESLLSITEPVAATATPTVFWSSDRMRVTFGFASRSPRLPTPSAASRTGCELFWTHLIASTGWSSEARAQVVRPR
jgi:hypothetical protein